MKTPEQKSQRLFCSGFAWISRLRLNIGDILGRRDSTKHPTCITNTADALRDLTPQSSIDANHQYTECTDTNPSNRYQPRPAANSQNLLSFFLMPEPDWLSHREPVPDCRNTKHKSTVAKPPDVLESPLAMSDSIPSLDFT